MKHPLIILTVAAALPAASLFAADTAWKGGANGLWTEPNNWTGNLPNTSDRATFAMAGGATVRLTQDTSAGAVAFNNYTTLFDFSGYTLTASGVWQLGGVAGRTNVGFGLLNGSVTGITELRIGGAANSTGNYVNVTGGELSTSSINVGYLAGNASMTLTNGSTVTTDALRISQFDNGTSNSVTVNGSTLNVGGNSTNGLMISAKSGGTNNRLDVLNGGKVNVGGILYIASGGDSNALTISGEASEVIHAYTGGGTDFALRIGTGFATNAVLKVDSGTFRSNAKARIYEGVGNRLEVNDGTVELTGSTVQLDGEIKQTGGDLSVSHLTVMSTGSLNFSKGKMTLGGGILNNSQTLLIGSSDGEGPAELHLSGANLTGTGALRTAGNGLLTGSGAFSNTGGVIVEGELAPGETDSTALMSFYSLNLTDSSTLRLQLGADSYDRILVSNLLTVEGIIEIGLLSDFVATAGARYDLIGWSSVDFTGFTLDDLLLPVLTNGLGWDTSEFLSSGALTVIPESRAITLTLAGVCALLLYSRRRLACRKR